MRSSSPRGFTLPETVVALTLFAGVLLSVIGSGQLVLARLYENDVRYRATVYAQSLIDSLRGTSCARLVSGQGTSGALAATWSVTDALDVMRIDLAISVPQRAGTPPRVRNTTALLSCPEP